MARPKSGKTPVTAVVTPETKLALQELRWENRHETLSGFIGGIVTQYVADHGYDVGDSQSADSVD